jgi:hypothetical protein
MQQVTKKESAVKRWEDRPNWASCFRPRNPQTEHPPDFTGVAVIDGKRFWVNVYKRLAKNGDRVDGEYHWNPREQKESRRSEEAVTAWRYAVIESDKAPLDLWLKLLVQLPLRISAIYTSGGSSIHALVRIDAESKSDWDEIVRRKLLPILVTLGADPGAMTAVRLSRLPNCMRGETKQLQKLLYINDRPDYTPICAQACCGRKLTEALTYDR